MGREAIEPTITERVSEHPSARAWAILSTCEPVAVTPLKEQYKASHKSGVYRMHGAGPGGESIIAKRCRTTTAQLERHLYENVFPTLPIAQLEYYGFVEEPDGIFCWLFLGDAGEERATPQEHRTLTAQWLGSLHSSACRDAVLAPLPDRGAGHYAEHLGAARAQLTQGVRNPALTDADRTIVNAVLRQWDRFEACWPKVERLSAEMPATLVHGDFAGKNVRVIRREGREQLVALDWETAGQGSPAADLAEMSKQFSDGDNRDVLEAYAATVRPTWSHITWREVLRAARIGAIFRLVASVRWTSNGLKHEWVVRSMRHLACYEPWLATALAELDEE